ncbi:type I restriction endonuclease subunit R [Halarcobacter bivalviorum]|uniref:type I restriction endonuclease subunit R n=1 Tax=Halarcobacter bivalviorum TaxID=663364 RepID=UPI00100A8CA7|nr:HsdR family type I site-specific deoxyribonuclease [Halarcobacter bivalviorum]RXK06458.1 type I restriction endonuclease [Halarcobacter bivalviorum]
MTKFTEEKLELAFIELLENQGITYQFGKDIQRDESEVLLEDDLKEYLKNRYKSDNITDSEIIQIVRKLQSFPSSDLYDSNKSIMKLVSDGFILKREDTKQKDIYIEFINYDDVESNNFKIVNQLEIEGFQKRIPDGILYINGMPLVVFEFKSAIREEATIHDAFVQLTTRYRRDIPELFKYNAFCVISDGVNNKAGSFFAPYEFFYSWRKITGNEVDVDGIASQYSMIQGMFAKVRLVDIIHNFIYMPDKSKKEEKIVCRYPQYYATRKLYENIKEHQKPHGDGKGGTYFGATGCGKSFTMLYLTRMLMKSVEFSSPTIILITDRTDLDTQLSSQFSNAKGFIGDDGIVSVDSRADLREKLQGRESGGVFLTTIHKFTEDIELLSERTNIICISDEAHRSQINLDQKVKTTKDGVKKTYGFAKYLHDSLPNATYVGFTGTPIDATLDVFGDVVDSYTMTESVRDEITVRIVYEGRAAKVLLDNKKLDDIEKYYDECAKAGANEHQIEDSKKSMSSMSEILGDSDRIKALAKDFVEHYEKRVSEGATLKGKAMFVSSSRPIAYSFFKELIALRPDWNEKRVCDEGVELTDKEKKEILPLEKVKMIMTRNKDDEKELWDMLGTKDYRKTLDTQFKNEKSNFKIAIVVDMWLTGFDVPFLDTIYIDKPIQQHNLIQTISRVNRKFEGKEKGLVVDYIGIKTAMNKALKQFSKMDSKNFEDIKASIVVAKDQLDLLAKLFHKFDTNDYFNGSPTEQLDCLNRASEYVQLTRELENRFMYIVKRLKSAYDICCGSEEFTQNEKDHIHFYLAVRSIVVKLTRGDAPDTAQMNAKVKEMISEALKSDGVEEIFKLGSEDEAQVDIFDEDYINKINKIKLPNTKIKLLQQLLAKALEDFKKVNKVKAVDFSKKFTALVDKYNERKEEDVLVSEVLEDFTDEIIDLYHDLQKEKESFGDMGIDFEEKAFYDILKAIAIKFDFSYPEDKLIELSKEVKKVVDDKTKYTDWNLRDDIKAELKVDLIMLLAKHGYPPITKDEVFKEIFEQAENFKKYRGN